MVYLRWKFWVKKGLHLSLINKAGLRTGYSKPKKVRWKEGRKEGEKDGRKEVKAGLRIAYSNQKLLLLRLVFVDSSTGRGGG